jgi:hypothetical protein
MDDLTYKKKLDAYPIRIKKLFLKWNRAGNANYASSFVKS